MYKREINLMDENLFPRKSEYKCKKNPTEGLSQPLTKNTLTNEEIIREISKIMIDSLGAIPDA